MQSLAFTPHCFIEQFSAVSLILDKIHQQQQNAHKLEHALIELNYGFGGIH